VLGVFNCPYGTESQAPSLSTGLRRFIWPICCGSSGGRIPGLPLTKSSPARCGTRRKGIRLPSLASVMTSIQLSHCNKPLTSRMNWRAEGEVPAVRRSSDPIAGPASHQHRRRGRRGPQRPPAAPAKVARRPDHFPATTARAGHCRRRAGRQAKPCPHCRASSGAEAGQEDPKTGLKAAARGRGRPAEGGGAPAGAWWQHHVEHTVSDDALFEAEPLPEEKIPLTSGRSSTATCPSPSGIAAVAVRLLSAWPTSSPPTARTSVGQALRAVDKEGKVK